jgi:predicted transcriptional regulator
MARKPAPPKPTAAELDLLRVLWTLGAGTAREVHEAVARDRPGISAANVLRQLQLMHGKGLLARDERQRSHVYAPAQPPESLRTNLLKDFIHKAFSGSGKALVVAALRDGHVTDAERDEIRRLLGEEDEA